MIDINVLGNGATQLIAIGTFGGGVFWICSQVFKTKAKLAEHDKCIEDSKEERHLLIEINKTILEVVAHGQNNGNVEKAEEKIQKFLNEKAHD